MPPSESFVNIALRAVTIAALGVVIGLADSMIRGPVMTKLAAPPPLTNVSGGGAPSPTPNAPAPAPGTTTPPPPDTHAAAPSQGASTPASEPAALPEGHISVADAKRLYDQQAAFVDSRKREDYEAGHVANAIRMELSDFKEGVPAPIEFMDKSKEVVVYCIGGHCDESEAVGKQLNLLGFTKVYVMHDGFPGWKDAGHPVETGPGQW